MPKRPVLKISKRDLLGKKVKQLRQKGIIPANLYGKKIKSVAVQVPHPEFNSVYRKAGETTIIDLKLAGEKSDRHILIRDLQIHPVSGEILHVDLQQVDLQEKVETAVPIVAEGEAAVERDKKGLVLQELDELSIEAPASKLPEQIKVNIAGLEEIGDTVRVKDLVLPAQVESKIAPDRVVFLVTELISEEAKELEEEEAAAAAEAAAEVTEEAKPEEAPAEEPATAAPEEPATTEEKQPAAEK